MGSKTSRLVAAGENPTSHPTTLPATHQQHDQSADSFNHSTTNSETHNSTSTSTHNSSIQTTTTINSILIDEEMYQQLINHANLNAPSHLLAPQRVTYSKIKNCVLFEDIHNDEYIMERYSMCLSDPKSMLETYLNLDNTITKQWDEKVKMLESEMMNSNNINDDQEDEDDDEENEEKQTENVSSSENILSNNSSTSSNINNTSNSNHNNNQTKKKKNAKNMHLFSPQFYEIIASAKATTEKTLNDSNEENLLESERKDLDEVKYALSFDVGLSQMDFENSSANIQENVAKVFEGLSNNTETPTEESSNQKKEVKWSDELLDLANSNNNTPIKKSTSNSISNTPNLHSNHTPITALTTSIAMDQILMTPPPQFMNNNSSNTPSQQPQQSTPGSNLTRSSAAADIPRDLTLSHHGIEGNSANIGASMTSALSESLAGTSNNTHGSFTENLSEDNLKDWWRSNPTLEKSIKIKLIVTDMHHHNKTKQTIRQIVSPLLSPVKILPAFGMFHTALVISEFKLEWTDSSLCIPRKLSSQSSFFSADIEEITTAHDLEDIVKKLSEVICRWNTTMIYSERKRKKKSKKPKKSSKSLKNYVNTGNCQDFIFDILDSIGKKEVLENLLNSDSPMGQYMRDMRKYGRCAMEFKMNHAFREKFSIKEKVKKFLTHTDLDLFVKQLETKDPDFKHNHKNEWILLKGFDRAFWIRHLAFKDNPDMRPLYEKQENVFEMTDLDMSDSSVGCCEVLACPFDDPQKTLSIILKN